MQISEKASVTRTWIRVGAFAGLLATIVYPVLLLPWSPPLQIVVVLALSFGLLFSTAALGGYHFVALNRKTVTLQLGTAFNVIAGTIVNLMLVIQLTVGEYMRRYLGEASEATSEETLRWIWRGVDKVQLGLDVAWDVYVSVGTFLIALNMVTHPRFGKTFGYSGALIAASLLVLNLWTFPSPPAEAGLVDLGPLMGLWGLAVSIQIIRSFSWADERIAAKDSDGPA